MSEEARFIDNGDGTIQDTKTGLAWCQKDSFQITQDWLDFQEAMAFIDKINKEDYLGFHDWRIAEKEEIEGLYFAEWELMGRSNQVLNIFPLFEPKCGNGSWCLPFDQQGAFYFSYQSGLSQIFDQDFTQGCVRPVRLWPED
ncbi:MAG: DUF1566 domain-containing protein [Nitrospina sp.]|nr:DUF1566 domain-containing protein [Nitrospinota bacterium]MCH8931636.1 DUF1566 domain-containing protein [Nitrospinota bacterium]TDJ61579.1 MAG: DUF1566 domain-containing protein [Nitrospina sp.]